jgi:hypothetical protein
MNPEKLVTRARSIVLQPREAWPAIAAETDSITEIYRDYVIWLAALPALGVLIGTALFGIHVPILGTIRIGFGTLLAQAVLSYLTSLLVVFLLALVVDALAPTFAAGKSRIQAFKSVVYAITPVWLAGALYILPWVGALVMLVSVSAAVYSVYLLKIGLPRTMGCPEDKSWGYAITVIVAGIVLNLAAGFVTSSLSGAGRSFDPATASVTPSAHFDKNSPGGKLQAWAEHMAAASQKVEQTQKSGDSAAQTRAAQAMIGAVLGADGKTQALAPKRLGALLPKTLLGMPRGGYSTERNPVMGIQISQAKARYHAGPDDIRLEITDMTGAKGLLSIAGFTAPGEERETEQGYEKTYRDSGNLVHERWNRARGRGEYAVVIAGRFVVKAEGKAKDIATLRKAAESIDRSALAKLAPPNPG